MLETFIAIYMPVAILLFIWNLMSGYDFEYIISVSVFWPLYLIKLLFKSFLRVFGSW